MTTYLVTGCAGFIGSHIVEHLIKLEGSDEVRGVDNLSTGSMQNIDSMLYRLLFRKMDVRDKAMDELVEGVDVIFHEAALGSVPRSVADPLTTHSNNVDGMLAVLELARKHNVKRVVVASSSSVYGNQPKAIKDESMCLNPLSPYAAGKAAIEHYCSSYATSYGLSIVCLRYFNVYGPRQSPDGPYAAVIPRFFEARLKGEYLTIYGDGEQTRDFTYVKDVVRANMIASEAQLEPKACLISNVAGGRPISINWLAELVGGKVVHRGERIGDVKHSQGDVRREKSCLGFTPEFSIEQGLELTREWFVSQQG